MKKDTSRPWRLGAVTGLMLLVMSAALGISSQARAEQADSLYIGDGGDSAVKRFSADTGAFLGAFVKSSLAGLMAPRGLVFDGAGRLIVSDQNVNANDNGPSIPGDILEYSATGQLFQRIIPHSSLNAPQAPRGVVTWNNALFVADLTTEIRPNRTPTPGRVLKYTMSGTLVGTLTVPPERLGAGEYHPRGLVIGPDGKLYVSNDPVLGGLGAQVFRFDPETGAFLDVFIASSGGAGCGCVNDLNRPEGLVFGPDGRLYVTSFRASADDTDKVMVFQGPHAGAGAGAYVDRIDLDAVGAPRTYAQALLFGPGGKLFVPITATGAVRRYDVGTKQFDVFVPANAQGGPLQQPWYLTFGKTHPGTLAYPTP